MLQMKSRGLNGDIHLFQKPWFETMAMFIGMFLCLICYWGVLLVQFLRRRSGGAARPLLSDEEKANRDSHGAKVYLYILAPASCDMCATLLMYIGLLMTTASVFQIMRGMMVVVSAFLTRFWLKRHLKWYKLVGVTVVILGLILVGMAIVLDPSHNEDSQKIGSPLLGILLIVGAQVVQGTQIVIEEVLLKNVSLPPLLIVGVEGSWGILEMCILLTVVYFIPGTDYGGKLENTLDTLVMLSNSAELLGFMLTYFVAILLYNYFGMCVTQCLSAVHRTILEAIRTACIWAADLLLWYWLTAGSLDPLGEWWTDWSVLELGGFVVMLLGSLIYNEFVILPKFDYMPEKTSH